MNTPSLVSRSTFSTRSPGAAAAVGDALVQLPADHGADQFIGGESGQFPGQHLPAVAHHGDPLAYLEDFFEAVRDEQHRRSRRAQRPRDVEQPVHLGR